MRLYSCLASSLMIPTSTAMLSVRLINTLLLAAAFLSFASVGTSERAITCDGRRNVHRLSCDLGVIRVTTARYGRADRDTCSERRRRFELANTNCSLKGTTELVRKRCNNKKVCEMNIRDVRTADPCRHIYKYLETEYTCVPAIHVIACEHSLAQLHCYVGQVIFVYGARYGREDSNICAYRRPRFQVRNKYCVNPTEKVAQRCNGKNTCTIKASNLEFGDPCLGTYKYLEVSYICEYPVY